MATLTIKNLPDDLYRRLKSAAAANHRSLNGEVITCLERSLAVPRPDAGTLLEQFRRTRRLAEGCWLTDRDLSHAKRSGRQ